MARAADYRGERARMVERQIAQRGISDERVLAALASVPREAFVAQELASYAYDLSISPEFAALNIEQQAMVVEHAFLATRGGRTPHPPEAYAALRAQWRRA